MTQQIVNQTEQGHSVDPPFGVEYHLQLTSAINAENRARFPSAAGQISREDLSWFEWSVAGNNGGCASMSPREFGLVET